MAKATPGKTPFGTKSGKRREGPQKGGAAQVRAGTTATGRVGAVMESAARSGLLSEKDGRIAGRISSALLKQAKARTGIQSDSELLAFALANVALEDRFSETFSQLAGTVDADLDLEF